MPLWYGTLVVIDWYDMVVTQYGNYHTPTCVLTLLAQKTLRRELAFGRELADSGTAALLLPLQWPSIQNYFLVLYEFNPYCDAPPFLRLVW